MNRRKFLKSFVGAVATVAIGLKLAQSMPKPELQLWRYEGVSWYEHKSVVLNNVRVGVGRA